MGLRMLATHWSLHDCTISDRYLEVSLSLRSECLFLHLSLDFCFPPSPSPRRFSWARCGAGGAGGCPVVHRRQARSCGVGCEVVAEFGAALPAPRERSSCLLQVVTLSASHQLPVGLLASFHLQVGGWS